MTGAATASFAYDGKQIKATVNGVTAVYVGQHYEVKGSVVTKYYFAGTTRLAVRTDGTLRFLLGDHLGSSSVTTNASGAKTASALYKAFGETRFTSGTLSTDYKFTGQREESALGGIYFFQSRWFDPSLGRFMSPDTIVPTSTQGTQAWDRYAFVNNNPVRYTDPTGHNVTCDLEPEECEFMKSHQTEGGGVAGTSSGGEGGGGEGGGGEGEGGGGKPQNSPRQSDPGCDPSKPDCIYATGDELGKLSEIYWGLMVGEAIAAVIALLLIAPAMEIPFVGPAIGLLLLAAGVELGYEAWESSKIDDKLNSIATSVGSSGGITLGRYQKGPEGYWGTVVHFQGFSEPGKGYAILGMVNKLVLNNWFDNRDN